MSRIMACPDVYEFERIARGELALEESEQFASHLEQCSSCASRMDSVAEQSYLGKMLRSGQDLLPLEDDTHIRTMISKLNRLCLGNSPADGKTTVPSEKAGPDTAASNSGDQEQEVDSLGTCMPPPLEPAELGQLGQYRLLRLIGSGGMGMVYQAEDTLLHRPTAVKAVKPGLAASAPLRQRFLREARAVANIRHEHVVAVYQAGEEKGVPYLAMEYLQGETLENRLARERKLSVDETVSLGRQIALGLAAIHARGLVHRDIKPGNVFLEALDGEDPTSPTPRCRVKVLDFGLVRDVVGADNLTTAGAILGTPAYMSPEQANGNAVDFHTDLFSLGAVLYRLCTGAGPFSGKQPLQTLQAVANHHPLAPHRRNPEVPEPLSNLIMKLLAKDPARRPATAREVAGQLQELERHLALGSMPLAEKEKPKAGPHPRTRRRRYLPMMAAGVVVVGLVILVAALFSPGVEPTPPLPPAPDKSPAWNYPLVLQPAKGKPLFTLETKLPRGPVTALACSPIGPHLASLGYDGTVRLWDFKTGKLEGLFIPPGDASSLTWSPQGDLLAIGDKKQIVLWDVAAGKVRQTLAGGHAASVTVVAWSPDGKRLSSGDSAGTVQVWSVESGKTVGVLEQSHNRAILMLSWSPAGDLAAFAAAEGYVRLWRTDTGAQVQQYSAAQDKLPRRLTWSKDGGTLIVASDDEENHLNSQGRKTVPGKLPPDLDKAYQVAWSPAGNRVALYHGGNQRLEVWDVKESKLIRYWEHITSPRALAWVSDGQAIAISATFTKPYGQGVRVFSVTGGKDEKTLEIPTYYSHCLAATWSPKGDRLATRQGGDHGMIWDSQTAEMIKLLPGKIRGTPVFEPEGKWVAYYGVNVQHQDGILIASAGPGSTSEFIPGGGDPVSWADGGKQLVSGGSAWNSATLQPLDIPKEHVLGLFSPNGKLRVTGGFKTQIWEVGSTKVVKEITLGNNAPKFAWAPDSSKLAINIGTTIHLYEVKAGQVEPYGKPLSAPPGYNFWNMAWSPDGKLLAASEAGWTHVWEAASGKEVHQLRGYGSSIGGGAVCWHPSGKTLLTSDPACTSFFWKADTGTPQAVLVVLNDRQSLAISPEGHYQGTPKIVQELLYVVQTEKGQVSLPQADFAKLYGWKNDPAKVRLTEK